MPRRSLLSTADRINHTKCAYGTGSTAAKCTKLGLVWANRPQPQLIEQRNKSHVAM